MHVLFATDGGDAALDAATLVVSVADRERTHITVLAVAPEGIPSLRYLDDALRPGAQRKANAEQAASDALRIFEAAGFNTHTLVTEGHPGREIIATAEHHAAGLIVMGSGITGLAGRLLGSVCNHVLHRTPSSVLIVRERPRRERIHVVAGVDGSEGSERALDVAMEFLDPQRCSITVLGVAELLTSTVTPPHVAHATSAPSPEIEARITQPARENTQPQQSTVGLTAALTHKRTSSSDIR